MILENKKTVKINLLQRNFISSYIRFLIDIENFKNEDNYYYQTCKKFNNFFKQENNEEIYGNIENLFWSSAKSIEYREFFQDEGLKAFTYTNIIDGIESSIITDIKKLYSGVGVRIIDKETEKVDYGIVIKQLKNNTANIFVMNEQCTIVDLEKKNVKILNIEERDYLLYYKKDSIHYVREYGYGNDVQSVIIIHSDYDNKEVKVKNIKNKETYIEKNQLLLKWDWDMWNVNNPDFQLQ